LGQAEFLVCGVEHVRGLPATRRLALRPSSPEGRRYSRLDENPDPERFEKVRKVFRDARARLHQQLHDAGAEHGEHLH
jgi:hypothetical protein